MSNMFTSAEAFSQNLDKWDTSNVTTMKKFKKLKHSMENQKQKCNRHSKHENKTTRKESSTMKKTK